jgi:hypothetical protein
VTFERGPGCEKYSSSYEGTLGLQAVFTGIPEIIYPNEPVSLKLSFKITKNTVKGFWMDGWADVDFDQWDVGPDGGDDLIITHPSFANADGHSRFGLSRDDNLSSYSETLTGTMGAGKEGSRLRLKLFFDTYSANMETVFIYEWKQVD